VIEGRSVRLQEKRRSPKGRVVLMRRYGMRKLSIKSNAAVYTERR